MICFLFTFGLSSLNPTWTQYQSKIWTNLCKWAVSSGRWKRNRKHHHSCWFTRTHLRFVWVSLVLSQQRDKKPPSSCLHFRFQFIVKLSALTSGSVTVSVKLTHTNSVTLSLLLVKQKHSSEQESPLAPEKSGHCCHTATNSLFTTLSTHTLSWEALTERSSLVILLPDFSSVYFWPTLCHCWRPVKSLWRFLRKAVSSQAFTVKMSQRWIWEKTLSLQPAELCFQWTTSHLLFEPP